MGTLPVEVSLREFKDFAGIKQPTVSEMKMSVLSATTRVTKFEANAAIDDAKFRVPEQAPPAADPGPRKTTPKSKAGKGKTPAG